MFFICASLKLLSMDKVVWSDLGLPQNSYLKNINNPFKNNVGTEHIA
jgi:hypothetical protein